MFTADMFAPIIPAMTDTLQMIGPVAIGLFVLVFGAKKGFSLLKSLLNKA